MKKFIGLCALMLAGSLHAAVVVDQIGDADGFGIGAVDGATFNFSSIGAGDGDGTDVWMYNDQSFTHTYDLSGLGLITSATLEIFTGGQGWNGLSTIYIDGALVGTLTDGDQNNNYARLDTFDLTSFLLDGSSTLLIDTVGSGDGWVLDYSRLTISDDSVSASVSEPASLSLLGLGLIGLGFARRRNAA